MKALSFFTVIIATIIMVSSCHTRNKWYKVERANKALRDYTVHVIYLDSMYHVGDTVREKLGSDAYSGDQYVIVEEEQAK